jgi:hypothetical protein
LVLWAAVGVGMATAGSALIAVLLGLRSWAWQLVMLSPGLWLSAQLLTSDALGFGLALLGLGLWLAGRQGWALVLLGLAPLAKDQFLLVGAVAAVWELTRGNRRGFAQLALASGLPLFTWSLILQRLVGGGFSPRNNFDWPFLGIASSARTVWPLVDTKDLVFTFLALAGLVVAFLGGVLTRHRLLRWTALSWGALGLVASSWVWDLGNNAMRALVPAMGFGILALGEWISRKAAAEVQPPTNSRRNLPV